MEQPIGVKLGDACPIIDGTCPKNCGFPVHFTITRAKPKQEDTEDKGDDFDLNEQQSKDDEECESCSA